MHRVRTWRRWATRMRKARQKAPAMKSDIHCRTGATAKESDWRLRRLRYSANRADCRLRRTGGCGGCRIGCGGEHCSDGMTGDDQFDCGDARAVDECCMLLLVRPRPGGSEGSPSSSDPRSDSLGSPSPSDTPSWSGSPSWFDTCAAMEEIAAETAVSPKVMTSGCSAVQTALESTGAAATWGRKMREISRR